MKKILKKCLVVIVMVGVASILLTSCATPQPSPSSSSPTAASTQPATSFKPEDYMVSLEEDWPTFSDPAVGADFSDMIAVTNVYDALVFVNNDNTIKPWLAEKWEMSPDGKAWTFYLRKGVKFHNGETLKASDVVFTLKRYHTIGEGTSWLWLNIDDAKAIDDYTVQFTLKKPFGPFLYTLVRFYVVSEKEVMAHLKQPGPYGEYGDFAKEWLLTHDAGCGPYKIKEVKTEEYVLMEKFDDWWGGWDPNAPKLFKLFAEPDSSTIRSLLANRELEITDEWQAIETYKAFAQIPGVKIAKYLVGHNFALRFHCAKPPHR
ncbi:MAG: ABC transporter substrate-binding protein [Caldiserica bacterium]|jgi:peptide/nickel transport system substrate-binding protein|nr:ABC transporter substrate-binding protein [Caldisericota bacterium]